MKGERTERASQGKNATKSFVRVMRGREDKGREGKIR